MSLLHSQRLGLRDMDTHLLRSIVVCTISHLDGLLEPLPDEIRAFRPHMHANILRVANLGRAADLFEQGNVDEAYRALRMEPSTTPIPQVATAVLEEKANTIRSRIASHREVLGRREHNQTGHSDDALPTEEQVATAVRRLGQDELKLDKVSAQIISIRQRVIANLTMTARYVWRVWMPRHCYPVPM